MRITFDIGDHLFKLVILDADVKTKKINEKNHPDATKTIGEFEGTEMKIRHDLDFDHIDVFCHSLPVDRQCQRIQRF